MFLYPFIAAIVAVIAGILIAACSKKAEGVTYTKLDKAGRITNIILMVIYVCAAPFCMIFAMFAYPNYGGFLGILGWIVAIIMGSVALFCGLGLGFSVALRKKGKSKQSFIAQFAGLAGIALNLFLFVAFYGNLLQPLE